MPDIQMGPDPQMSKLTPEAKAEIFARMEELWASLPQLHDSAAIIEEDRSR